MKTITKALTAVLTLGTLGVAQAQTGYQPGYKTICGPTGCTVVPTSSTSYPASTSYAAGYDMECGPYGCELKKPVSTLPAYGTSSYGSSSQTICGPDGCYQVPTPRTPVTNYGGYQHDRFGHAAGQRWDDRLGSRRDGDRFGHDRLNDNLGRSDRMFDDNRFDNRYDLDRNHRNQFEPWRPMNAANYGHDWR